MNHLTSVIRYGQTGFTLMEVLVSITVMAIVLASLFRMQSGTADLAAQTRFMDLAPLLSSTLITRIEQDPAGETDDRGSFAPAFDAWTWESLVSDAAIEHDRVPDNDSGTLKKIELTLKDGSGNRTWQVTTFRYVEQDLR